MVAIALNSDVSEPLSLCQPMGLCMGDTALHHKPGKEYSHLGNSLGSLGSEEINFVQAVWTGEGRTSIQSLTPVPIPHCGVS